MKCDISIIYVYYNTPKEILDSIKTVRSGIGNFTYEIIVVDNSSPQPFPKNSIKEKIILLRNEINEGYGVGLNKGASIAKGKYLLLVNPDILFAPNCIEEMVRRLEEDSRIGILGPQVLATDNTIAQSIGGLPFLPGALIIFSFLDKLFPKNKFSEKYWLSNLDRSREWFVECVSGVCMLVRRKVFDEVNGFDSQFFMYFEEADFCIRVKRVGYKILYYPETKIMHLGGQSMKDKQWIQKIFEKSRFLFFKKYHGFLYAILSEFFIRFMSPTNLLLLTILSISAFLNLYKINELMMFFGDFGRDYLAARDMIVSGKIPFVGIQTSVTWLNQGPLSVYFIAFAFLVGNFHPVAPAVLYGMIGIVSTYLVYKLGKLYFNPAVGLLSSVFYATSPMVVINTRMPYHTAIIPFLTILVFIYLYKALNKNSKYLPLLFFLIGLLLQTELSNAVLFFILPVIYLLKRPKFSLPDFLKSSMGFLFGILPFVLYDLNHGFVQTLGFPIWIINRIRLFFGLTASGNSTTVYASSALSSVWDNLIRIIFPASEILAALIIMIAITILVFNLCIKRNLFIIKSKNIEFYLVLLWIFVPILGFIIHGTPGQAYFPFIFPAICVLVGLCFYELIKKVKLLIFLFIILLIYNSLYIVKNEYFLSTQMGENPLPPNGYSFGTTWTFQDDIAKFIVSDAKGRAFSLRGGGFLSTLETGIDNYKYLVLWRKGILDSESKISYTIFQDQNGIPRSANIVFKNKYFFVEKNEK